MSDFHRYVCPLCGRVWESDGSEDFKCPHCTDLKQAVRDAHADLRLRFALALVADFSALATAMVRVRGVAVLEDPPPPVWLFDLADALALEHERRCKAEEASA